MCLLLLKNVPLLGNDTCISKLNVFNFHKLETNLYCDIKFKSSLKQIVNITFLEWLITAYIKQQNNTNFLMQVITTILSLQGDKENVVTHWTMDPHQAKMCLAHSVNNSLIPGKVLLHVQYIATHCSHHCAFCRILNIISIFNMFNLSSELMGFGFWTWVGINAVKQSKLGKREVIRNRNTMWNRLKCFLESVVWQLWHLVFLNV